MKRFASLASLSLYSIAAGLMVGVLASFILGLLDLALYVPTPIVMANAIAGGAFYGICIMSAASIAHAVAESLEG